jgi:hypothetical protein
MSYVVRYAYSAAERDAEAIIDDDVIVLEPASQLWST